MPHTGIARLTQLRDVSYFGFKYNYQEVELISAFLY